MDRFVGTWKQTSVENLEAFLTATGTTQEDRKAFIRQTLTSGKDLYEKVEVSGDDITISEGRDAEHRQVKKAKLGQEVDFARDGGSTFKLFMQMDGDKLVETSTGSYNSVLVREVDGNVLTHKLTSNGVTAVRKFTKI